MEGFQKFVLFSAILILIITLVLIGLALRNTKKTQQWPPMVPECPDYWTMDVSGSSTYCLNKMNLGNCRITRKDFNDATFKGEQGLCNKYKWATGCGISWDGITYGAKNPCFQAK